MKKRLSFIQRVKAIYTAITYQDTLEGHLQESCYFCGSLEFDFTSDTYDDEVGLYTATYTCRRCGAVCNAQEKWRVKDNESDSSL